MQFCVYLGEREGVVCYNREQDAFQLVSFQGKKTIQNQRKNRKDWNLMTPRSICGKPNVIAFSRIGRKDTKKNVYVHWAKIAFKSTKWNHKIQFDDLLLFVCVYFAVI